MELVGLRVDRCLFGHWFCIIYCTCSGEWRALRFSFSGLMAFSCVFLRSMCLVWLLLVIMLPTVTMTWFGQIPIVLTI